MCRIVFEDYWIIQVPDEIDMGNVDAFEAALEEVLSRKPKGFIIDLSQAKYMDSTGLRAVVAAYQKISAVPGRIATVIANKTIRRLFELTRLEALPGLYIVDDLELAKQALDASRHPLRKAA